jgi:hypothetical protein
LWSVDPVLAPFKQIPVTGRLGGYAGSPNQKAAEVQTKYIVVDMYEGDPGHVACRCGQVGARRDGQGLQRLIWSTPSSAAPASCNGNQAAGGGRRDRHA